MKFAEISVICGFKPFYQKMNKTTTDKAIFNGVTDAVQFARDEISQNDLAKKRGVPVSTFSRNMTKFCKGIIVQLAVKVEQSVSAMELERNRLSQELNKAEQAVSTMELERNRLERENEVLSHQLNELSQKWNSRDSDISPVKWMKGRWSKFILCVSLALLDYHILAGLLVDKIDFYVAHAVAIGLSIVLVSFTINTSKRGRNLAIALTFVAAGLYFHFLEALSHLLNAVFTWQMPKDEYLADLTFTILPPWINVVLSEMLTKEKETI